MAKQEGLSEFDWQKTGLVVRNDVQVRKLEGLTVDAPVVAKDLGSFDLTQAPLVLEGAAGRQLILKADLVEGQKTGFFLDQWENIQIVLSMLERSWKISKPEGPIRILDLCCYVGHWGTQLAALCKEMDITCEVVLFDISKTALEFASKNVRAHSDCSVTAVEGDVLEELTQFADSSFDIVIADPPAFIKNKKDVPIGRHAYLKMNSQAFRIARSGGWVVSCSCSGLLIESDFAETLSKSASRGKKKAIVVGRGGHGADHPFLHSFPEGRYLKMFLQQVE
ncbi:MAG: methyltransferase domain-containing protein [Pseudobdellovibrionaceae bacterium]